MVKIITDTTACLSPEIAQRYGIPIIPQIITLGTESFFEGIDIDTETFLAQLKDLKELPKTSAPPPELFVNEFRKFAQSGEAIICIHPSSEVSGTVRSAQVASMDFPGMDIRVIDSRIIASPLGTLVQFAAEWASCGMDAHHIELEIKKLIPRCRIYFLVDTLEFLARGGRIGGASALLGSLLQIKPILTMLDGKVDQYERERTHSRALHRLKEIVMTQVPQDGSAYLSIMHAGNLEEANSLALELGKLIHQDFVPVSFVPPAIITHGGPGILAAAFFTSENLPA